MNNKSSRYFLFKLIYLSLNVGLLEITETVSFPSCTLCLFQMLIILSFRKTICSYKSTSFVFLKLPTFCLRNWNCVSKWGWPKIRNQPFQRDKARVWFCYYDIEHDLSLFPLVVVAPCCCLLASCSLWAKAIASILSCSSCEVGAAWADEEAAAWVVTSLIEACNARAKASSSLKLPWSWLVLGLVRGCVGWDCCCLVKYLAIPCGGWFCLAKAALPASETCFVGLPVQSWSWNWLEIELGVPVQHKYYKDVKVFTCGCLCFKQKLFPHWLQSTLISSLVLHLTLEHLGFLCFFAPQSLSKCLETASSGTDPGLLGTGLSHKGHTGTWISWSFGEGHECPRYVQCCPQNLFLQPSHLTGRKSNCPQDFSKHWSPIWGSSMLEDWRRTDVIRDEVTF